ncbi:MAG: cation:proton antiporter [Planctomycetota bacterium]|nr:cation:proton antiporter [Planctomycetota bacterium]
MNEHALLMAGLVLGIGLTAQWLAWRLRLPSILLLLLAGLLVGPVTGFLNPDDVMGDLLFPFVSLAVAVILFEGGLSLRLSELRGSMGVLRLLISVGSAVSVVVAYYAGTRLLGLPPGPALLLAAIYIVTGPTVIIPLLRHVRPRGKVGPLIRWEGIVNDPIGATLALLVFDVLLASGPGEATQVAALVISKTLAAGLVLGLGSAWLLARAFARHVIPDFLQNPAALTAVVVVFVLANHVQEEAGLLAVTVMGMGLANQKRVDLRHVVEFKENLQVLLLAALFVLLAARIETSDLALLDWRAFAFVAVMILVARPVGVLLSTIGSDLNRGERIFLAWMAPRGIVAMAVVSLFALRLEVAGVEGIEPLVPVTFLLVVVTVLVYGLTAAPLARKLGIAAKRSNGVLFVGSAPWTRELALTLGELDVESRLVDTNRRAVAAARLAGLGAVNANALTDDISRMLDLGPIGSVLAVTRNDEINTLIGLRHAEWFGRSNAYCLQAHTDELAKHNRADGEHGPVHLGGRPLFGEGVSFEQLSDRFAEGATFRKTKLSDEFSYEKYLAQHGDRATPLFLVQADQSVYPWTPEGPPAPKPGDVIVALIDPEE